MADVYVNALTTISTEPTSTDSVVCVNRNTNEGQIIDYNLLADVILSKISSKTFSSLTTTSKLLPGAINELDADVASLNGKMGNLSTLKVLCISSGNSTKVRINGITTGSSLIVPCAINNKVGGLYITRNGSAVNNPSFVGGDPPTNDITKGTNSDGTYYFDITVAQWTYCLFLWTPATAAQDTNISISTI